MSAPGSMDGGILTEPDRPPASKNPAEQPVGPDHQRLIDQLVPPAPSPLRRFVAAAAIIAAAIAIGLAWQIGLIVPEPTARSETMQSAVLGVAPDGRHVVIDGLTLENMSLTTLELTDVRVDAPGLIVDRITWTDALHTGSTTPQELPAVMASGSYIRIELWVRPEICSDPQTGEWGEVSGRWQYPDRPSWLGRWEALDNPLWNADADPNMMSSDVTPSALSLNPVRIAGSDVELDGPLSAACLLLGIDQ
ncbi:MAG: hypothetical protein OEW83_01830 [Acidimicrobiia bacterium]|nr:hypothetical protein [Acidimicrobiia bacterium]